MASIINTTRLSKHLAARGLVPANCRLVEVSITPSGPLVIRYEVFVGLEQMQLFAEACVAAAEDIAADDARNLQARISKPPESVNGQS